VEFAFELPTTSSPRVERPLWQRLPPRSACEQTLGGGCIEFGIVAVGQFIDAADSCR